MGDWYHHPVLCAFPNLRPTRTNEHVSLTHLYRFIQKERTLFCRIVPPPPPPPPVHYLLRNLYISITIRMLYINTVLRHPTLCIFGLLNLHHYLHVYWKIPLHDDVIKWELFPRYWPFVRGIHRSPVNFPNKGHWRGALMFSFICAWINGCVNNCGDGDLKRHLAHCDVIIVV